MPRSYTHTHTHSNTQCEHIKGCAKVISLSPMRNQTHKLKWHTKWKKNICI